MIEIPGYTIKREIGQGGMASVYLAVQSSLERQVALKVMANALAADPTFTRRFLQEARMLASLAHPNIVQVFDVGVTPNQQHYFSMQYLAGGDFIARVQRGMDENELKRVLTGVARALGYAHQRGYVHRDVAPGNILFDSAENPVLTDFGIALAASQATRITSTGFSVGTSHYMSPEQARGGDVDARSDLYSLGVLGFYGLTGRPPFDGADGFAVAYAHVFEPIPRLPPEKEHWQSLFDRALAKDPKDRFADVDQFIVALEALAIAPAASRSAAKPEALPPVRPPIAAAKGADAGARAANRTVNVSAPARPDALKRPSNPVGRTATGSRMGLWIATSVLGVLGVAALTAYFWPAGSPRGAATVAPVANASTLAVPASTSIAPAATVPKPVAPTPAPVAAPSAPAVATTGIDTTSVTPAIAPNATPLDAAIEVAPVDALVTDANVVEPGTTPELPIDPLANVPTVEDPVPLLVKLGRTDLAAQRFSTPPGQNALEHFRLALRIDARDKSAKQGIVDTARAYVGLGDKANGAGDLATMNQHFGRALEVAALVPEGKTVVDEIAQHRAAFAAPFVDEGKRAAAAWDKPTAQAAYQKALALDPTNALATEGLKKLPSIGAPGFVFRDKLGGAGNGPDLVVLPGAKVAAGRYEVSRAEFRRYWSAQGGKAGSEPSCRDRESFFRGSRKRNWQNAEISQEDNHPVVCVSWDQAAGFARWLSETSGKTYRLLSNAEWDQLVRDAAGRGDCRGANLADASFKKAFDTRTGADCDDGFAATAPTGRFGAVATGVYDIDGNVREWVNACANGAATAGCRDHRARGRSWMSAPDKEQAGFSDNLSADVASNTIGFRVARELDGRK